MPETYTEEDILTYRTYGGTLRRVLVIEIFHELDGSGFIGFLLNADGERTRKRVWGYEEQIVSVGDDDEPDCPSVDGLLIDAEEIRDVARAFERDRDPSADGPGCACCGERP